MGRRGNKRSDACQQTAIAPNVAVMRQLRFPLRTLRAGQACLALFAVLLQFIASIGHLHPEDYRFLLRGHGALELAAADPFSHRGANGLAADADCAICASLQLLGSAALPDGGPPLMPQARIAAAVASDAALWLVARHHLLFVTRGPPLV
jgi:hypothetical protein